MIKKLFKVLVTVCFCINLMPMTAESGRRILPPALEEVNALAWQPAPLAPSGVAVVYKGEYKDIHGTQWHFEAACNDSTKRPNTLDELRRHPHLPVTALSSLLIGPEVYNRLIVHYSSSDVDWAVHAFRQGPANAIVANPPECFEIPE